MLTPERTVLNAIADQISCRPDAPALMSETQCLTYSEMDLAANRLAHLMETRGVSQSDVVAVLVSRDVIMPLVALAVMRLGAAYLPLESLYPTERIRYMLEDSEAATLVTDSTLFDHAPKDTVPLIVLDQEAAKIATMPSHAPQVDIRCDDACYVIYTSGSTGTPKGSVNLHGGFANLIDWYTGYCRIGVDARVLIASALTFDTIQKNLFAPLTVGGAVCMTPGGALDLPGVERVVKKCGATHINGAPSNIALLFSYGSAELLDRLSLASALVLGGEPLFTHPFRAWLERADSEALFVNTYGPSECSDVATYHIAREQDLQTSAGMPLGRCIPGVECVVVDDALNRVPHGEEGEICVYGRGLGQGYLNAPARTAEKFVPNPFSRELGARLYRTGDLGWVDPDGLLWFGGRQDTQIKLRGYRIDLGEIEVQLSSLPGIRSVAVILRGEGEHAELHAFATPNSEIAAPDIVTVREALGQKLPHYMLPASLTILPRLPHSPNGKLDRGALTELEPSGEIEPEDSPPPPKGLEGQLAEIWQDVIGTAVTSVEQNFFSLGGDSVRALQVVLKLQEIGLPLTIEGFYRHQTIADLAAFLQSPDNQIETVSEIAPFTLLSEEDRAKLPSDAEDALPLSSVQCGMLFHSAFTASSALYRNVLSLELRCVFDAAALGRAVRRLVLRHRMLRTSFDLTRYSEPVQIVHRDCELPVEIVDLRGLDRDEQDRAVIAGLEKEWSRGFDWTIAPLVRLLVHRRSEDELQFTLHDHHAVLDGWSMTIFFQEIFTLYLLELGRQAPPLPEIAPDQGFATFVRNERALIADPRHTEFWAGKLHGLTAGDVRLPDKAGRVFQKKRGVRYVKVPVDDAVSNHLRDMARQHDMPLKTLLLATHVIALGIYTERSDIVTGLVTHTRPPTPQVDREFGMFLNTVPLRIGLADKPDTLALAAAIQLEEIEMLPHAHLPLVEIQKEIGLERIPETLFNFTDFHVYRTLKDLDGVEFIKGIDLQETEFALVALFNFDVFENKLELTLGVSRQRFSTDQVNRIAGAFAEALKKVSSNAGLAFGPETGQPAISLEDLPPKDTAHLQPSDCSEAVRLDLERRLEALMRDTLGRDVLASDVEISSDANFFALGGDSITAMRFCALASSQGLTITPHQIFVHPTLSDLARAIYRQSTIHADPQDAFHGDGPLAPIQSWFFQLNLASPAHWFQSVMIEASAPIRPDALQRAATALCQAREAMRTVFVEGEETWHRRVLPESPPPAFAYVMVESPQDTALVVAAETLAGRLDLRQGPLVGILLIEFGSGLPARLFLIAHHLIIDTASWHFLVNDLLDAYTAELEDRQPVLPAETASYDHYSRAFDTITTAPHLDISQTLLLGSSNDRTNLEADMAKYSLSVPFPAAGARQGKGQPVDFALAIWTLAFAEFTATDKVAVLMEEHGRNPENGAPEGLDLSRVIGWFTSFRPILIDITDAIDMDAALNIVMEKRRSAPAHWLRPQVAFNFLGEVAGPRGGWRVVTDEEPPIPDRAPKNAAPFVIEVAARLASTSLMIDLRYSAKRYDLQEIETLSGLIEAAANKMDEYVRNGNGEVEDFEWDEGEREKIISSTFD